MVFWGIASSPKYWKKMILMWQFILEGQNNTKYSLDKVLVRCMCTDTICGSVALSLLTGEDLIDCSWTLPKLTLCGLAHQHYYSPCHHLTEVLLSTRIQLKHHACDGARNLGVQLDFKMSSDREDLANNVSCSCDVYVRFTGYWDARWQRNWSQHLS